MKTLQFLQILFLLTLSTCDSCKEEFELPPETQTGENTFGCYVNGELFVKGKDTPFTEKRLNAEYQINKKLLIISSHSNTQYIYMEIKEPEVNRSKPISTAYLLPERGIRDCIYFGGKEIGEIAISKLDTLNGIVSGQFHFPGQCSDYSLDITGDSIVSITQGRFDIRLQIYNNYGQKPDRYWPAQRLRIAGDRTGVFQRRACRQQLCGYGRMENALYRHVQL